MRVFLTSVPDDLAPYRDCAREMVRELGWQVRSRDDDVWRIEAAVRAVDDCDLVLALVGWARGPVPDPEAGGDGVRPWVQWEVERAFADKKQVLVFMAGDTWPERFREIGHLGRSTIVDFRGEIARLANTFDYEDRQGPGGDRPAFRRILKSELERFRASSVGAGGTSQGDSRQLGDRRLAALRLRRAPSLDLPAEPYPVLLPYSHPELLAGRDGELSLLRKHLGTPIPIVGLYAASGVGKSSFLGAGLVPMLQSSGHPVALVRDLAAPGLASRLLGQLLDGPAERLQINEADHGSFVEHLLTVRHLSGDRAPLLVLDQFEDLFRATGGRRRARTLVGTLLAATLQRQPGVDGPLVRWLLAYRQEYHGELFLWLTDVLREAQAEGLEGIDSLPHNLSGPDRFRGWALTPLATPTPGSTDRLGEAVQGFLAAIEQPLALQDDDGKPRYRYHFTGNDAERLARAFAEARLARPAAPLVPELQVVLARLLERASDLPRAGDGSIAIDVPDDPGEMVGDALEQHLCDALLAAFPLDSVADRIGRTRALLALRELADFQGRRPSGRSIDELARAIGKQGRTVLEKLATPSTRLVVLERRGADWVYVLSHDRMAEVLIKVIDEEGRGSRFSVDGKLLRLHRFVALKTELWAIGEHESATDVPSGHFRLIEDHQEALLWEDERKQWWRACRERRQRQRRRRIVVTSATTLILSLTVLAVGIWFGRRAQRQTLLEQIATGEPDMAVAALVQHRSDSGDEAGAQQERFHRLSQRETPLDLLENGLGGVPEAERAATSLWLAELSLAFLEEAPEDPARISIIVWALDLFAARSSNANITERALELRDHVLAPLRDRHPPPPLPGGDAPGWVHVPAGTFLMGSTQEESPNRDDEWPQHQVSISAFRMADHEVTRAEYRRLVPDYAGEDEKPASGLNWYEAYTYAAWLGGRLPTEAEWEYTTRAGCSHRYCDRVGRETTLSEIAWWTGNATDPETFRSSTQPVRQLQPNRFGFYDMLGNIQEWVATRYDPYPSEPASDPVGPPSGSVIHRGGSAGLAERYVTPSQRIPMRSLAPSAGLRVVVPLAPAGGN